MINPLLNPAYSLPPPAAAVVGLILLVVVLCKGRRTRGKWLFSALLISMALWNLLIFGMRSSPNTEQALIWVRIATVPGFAIFALFYHFILAFTKTEGQRYVLIIAYTILVAFVVLTPTDLVIKNLRVESYGYAPVQGPVTFILSPLIFAFMGFTAYNLVRRYRQSSSNNERNRIYYLLMAILFPLVGSLLDSFTNLPPAYVWGNLIFCLLCTVAILRYHLLDIHIAMRRGLVYLIMSAIVAIPYVGVLYLLHRFIEPATGKWWVHSAIILALAILLRPIYSHAQDWVNRLFYRDRYSYFRALERFAQEIQSIKNLEKLGASTTHLVKGALRASSICLLLPSEGQRSFTVVSRIGLKRPTPGVMLSNSSPLVRWLDIHGDIVASEQLDVTPKLQSLSLKDKNNLKRMEAELCVPLKTRQGQLSGILILGPKLSRQPYSNVERRLLATLSSQMAIALENARLYDSEKTARIELEKLNEQKTEFLHSVAHELKTPLTAIISSSELLDEEQDIAMDIRKRLIGNINRSSLSMNRRVSELLDLATMQIGKLEINVKPQEIGGLITDVVQQLQIIFTNKDQRLKLDIPLLLPKVVVDKEKLEQVLFNLLSNASKFSPVGSETILRVRRVGNDLIIEVEDSAPPVTEEEKVKLFDPYYRGGDESERKRLPGLGLGLAISKTIVELHKGEIWVESKPTKGNIFAFSLPALYSQTNGVK